MGGIGIKCTVVLNFVHKKREYPKLLSGCKKRKETLSTLKLVYKQTINHNPCSSLKSVIHMYFTQMCSLPGL